MRPFRVTRKDIIQELFDCMNIAKRGMYTRMRTLTSDLPVSQTQLELLFTIKHLQPISFKQLAAQLQLTPGAISQLADSLDHHGLIERQADQNDRRTQHLQLSEAGDKLLQTVEKRRQETMQRVVQGLTTDELTVWLRIQQKMIAEFQTVLDNKQTKKGADV